MPARRRRDARGRDHRRARGAVTGRTASIRSVGRRCVRIATGGDRLAGDRTGHASAAGLRRRQPAGERLTLVPTLRAAFAREPTWLAFFVGPQDMRLLRDNVKFNAALVAAHVPHRFVVYPGGPDAALWASEAGPWLAAALERVAAPPLAPDLSRARARSPRPSPSGHRRRRSAGRNPAGSGPAAPVGAHRCPVVPPSATGHPARR